MSDSLGKLCKKLVFSIFLLEICMERSKPEVGRNVSFSL